MRIHRFARHAVRETMNRHSPRSWTMKQRRPFLLRMDPSLYAALETWAQQELRSLNGQIEYLLRQAVARRGKELPEDITPPPPELDDNEPEA
jgi:hypothetical protein